MTKQQVLNTFTKVLSIVRKDNACTYFKKHFTDEYNYVIKNTEYLNKFNNVNSFFERIYCIEHNLADRPKCCKCHEKYVCSFNTQKNEYRKWCTPKCQASDKQCIIKSKETRLKKYGNENYTNTNKRIKIFKEKCKLDKTYLNKIIDKRKNTLFKRYGTKTFINVEKAKRTKLQKYGNENYANLAKAKLTKLEKYGDENYNNRQKFVNTLNTFSEDKWQEINNKRKETCRKRYNVNSIALLQQVSIKKKQTCIQKYGVKNVLSLKNIKEKSIEAIKLKSWKHIQNQNIVCIPLFSQYEYIHNRLENKIWKWQCSTCGYIYDAVYTSGIVHKCPKCFPSNINGTSQLERDIFNYVKLLISNEIVLNHTCKNKKIIKHRELDIWIPERKIAIEVNGLYYHSNMFSEKPINYHLRKTEECDKLGIQLIHIFEDEWNYKKKIVKSILKTTLNKNRYKIQFDNCNIKLIDINLKDKFLNKYHIDGTCESDLNFGLFLRNKLIALFACKKINNNYEIFRYAIIFNFTIINCFDSFLKYFSEKYNPNLVYFTIDRRWNNTKQFNSLDFIVEKIIMPQYTYVKNNHRYNINEYQEIDNNKKYIIYDCGKIKLVKQFKK